MKRHHQQGWSLPIVPLIEFAFGMDEASLSEHQRTSRAASPIVDCADTHRELERADIWAPAMSDDLIQVSVESMLARNADLYQREPLRVGQRGAAS